MKKQGSLLILLLAILFSKSCCAYHNEHSLIIQAFRANLKIYIEDHQINPLVGGYSGASLYTVTTPEKRYVVRITKGALTTNPENEIKALKAASNGKYGPYVFLRYQRTL